MDRDSITGVVLAGGQGTRMGGADKGLQRLDGIPLAARALSRLMPQVGSAMVVANRHLDAYRALGVPVVSDPIPGQPGPLAGFLAGLAHADTPWVLTVPCDAPDFPLDLAVRLAAAAAAAQAPVAVASDGTRMQPVFCLMHRSLHDALRDFLRDGGRKVGEWTARHRATRAVFDTDGAFANLNSEAELIERDRLQRQPTPGR
ncbi:MAG: molybdenum cofactor guanylyltransferase [Comamonadaceae bacterium]|nr:MAG: molybdenum cofactor guanylyltransferase [Comamonadaceae bacterium]